MIMGIVYAGGYLMYNLKGSVTSVCFNLDVKDMIILRIFIVGMYG